jgi:hypothetical protein
LTTHNVTGRLVPAIEHLLSDPDTLHATARALVDAEFPPTIAGEVLTDAGLDPDPTPPLRRHRHLGATT